MNRPERIFKDILFTRDSIKNLGSILDNTPKESKQNVQTQIDELEKELDEQRDLLATFVIDNDKKNTIRRTVLDQLHRYKKHLEQCVLDYDNAAKAPSQSNELSKKLCADMTAAILVDSRGSNDESAFKWAEIRCDDGDSGKFVVFVDEEIERFNATTFDDYVSLLDYYTAFQNRICNQF